MPTASEKRYTAIGEFLDKWLIKDGPNIGSITSKDLSFDDLWIDITAMNHHGSSVKWRMAVNNSLDEWNKSLQIFAKEIDETPSHAAKFNQWHLSYLAGMDFEKALSWAVWETVVHLTYAA